MDFGEYSDLRSPMDATPELYSDQYFMREALKQALMAYEDGEVPIGAVVVSGNKIIGRGYNQVERLKDATAHAEMLAITAAGQFLGSKYLQDCTLFVTVEPCPMCAGASRWVQFKRIVYGAPEPKFGYLRFGQQMLHPKTEIVSGVLSEDAMELMISFFQEKRK